MKLTAWEQFPKPVRKAWMVMRLSFFFILFFALHLSARTAAQRITLSSNGISMGQFLVQLQKQTPYSFLLEDGLVSPDLKIDVHVNNELLENVLNKVLIPLGLTYRMDNMAVYIVKSVSSDPVSENSGAPPIEIHGRVTDSLGNPLAGASVFVKGTRKGAITDVKGEFTLKGVTNDKTLLISFTGYINKEYKTNSSSFDIVLKRSNNPLDQVQIIAYGTTTQRLSTADISVVTAKEIEEQPVSNPLAALEGRVPGLIISQGTGVPGGNFNVIIRGQNSLSNGNDPFYVVDGVPYASQTVNIVNYSQVGNHSLYGNNGSAGSPLNYLNPSDIESISILKDADATSIYGSRAANGAILITTKKGKAGDARVDFNVYSGFGEVSRTMPMLNTQQYLQMRHEAFYNDRATPDPNADFDLTFWDTTRYTNWQKTLIGNKSHYTDAQVSVSGGNENTQYLIGGGYHRETTVFPGTFADQKASGHFNINSSSLNKKFKISATASYVADKSNVPPNDPTPYTFLPPDAPPLYNADGSLNWAPMAQGQSGTWNNPLAQFLLGYNARINNLVTNALVTYTIMPGLNISSSFGYTYTQTNEVQTYPLTSDDPGRNITTGQSVFNTTNSGTWIIEPQATYSLGLGKGVLKALVGTTFEENTTNGQEILGTGYSNDALLYDIQAATMLSVQSVQSSDYKYNAFFGRVSYNWQDKYILNAAVRRDGSSRFGPANQFANFGSVAGAWIFSKENFIQNTLPFISFGKLRASYGTSGNDQIGDYRFLDLYGTTQYPYQNTQGLFPQSLFNPNLAWELDKKLEGSIMLGFLKDRITAEASYYVNRSANQLVSSPLASLTGFTSISANLPALVQNTGLEVVLNTINISTHDFRWTTSVNLSVPRNKLVSYPGLATSGYQNKWIVGQPVSIQKVYNYAGINDSAGIYQFKTAQGATTFNPIYPNDLSAIVNPAPKYYGGFENSFTYKGFQLDILFQFVEQTGYNINGYFGVAPGFMSNQSAAVLDRWQQPGDVKTYQQFTQSYSSNAYNAYGNYYYQSNAVWTDASFIRLKNVSISYSLPESTLHKMHIRNLSFYVHGQNLLTITKYLGFDPETQGLALPPLRVLALGIQLGL